MVASGKTVLRNWDRYLREMTDAMQTIRSGSLQGLIAWTIDDDKKNLALLQIGITGIMTNRVQDLARLRAIGFADHDRAIEDIASCFREHDGSATTTRCATQPRQLSAPLRAQSLTDRACDTKPNGATRDAFGCGLFNRQDIQFSDEEQLYSSESELWWNAEEQKVEVR